MKWYGIKLNEKPLGFSTSASHGEFCVDVEFSLNEYSDNVLLVKQIETAQKAMVHDTPWFNAGYESPRNHYIGKKLEIFEVEI